MAEDESGDDTSVSNTTELGNVTDLPPTHRVELEMIRRQVNQMRQRRPIAPHQHPVNQVDNDVDYNNGADRGFEWEHYDFEDPYNPDWLPDQY